MYICTATDGNMSLVALNLEKGFFAVATYQRSNLSICEVRWFEEGYGIDITEQFVQMLEKNQRETLTSFIIVYSLFTICSGRFCTIT